MDRAIVTRAKYGLIRVLFICLIIGLLVIGSKRDATAYAIQPTGTPIGDSIHDYKSKIKRVYNESKFAEYVIKLFMDPVHECITNMIYDDNFKNYKEFSCKRYKDNPNAPDAVLAGVQWNDNPPFKLNETGNTKCMPYADGKTVIRLPYAAVCWYVLFRNGAKLCKKGVEISANSEKNYALLYRIHYGDLQFVHSMAGKDGEPPEKTRKSIMAWAEFTYKIANNELSRFTKLNSHKGLRKFFYKKDWKAQKFFIQGERTYHADKNFRDFVFGALLHTVQDSFVASHTERGDPEDYCKGLEKQHYAPGKIIKFYSYANQDDDTHAIYDQKEAFLENDVCGMPPSCVEVGKVLRSFYESGTKWNNGVRQYLSCVFALHDDAEKSGPGDFTAKVKWDVNVNDDEIWVEDE